MNESLSKWHAAGLLGSVALHLGALWGLGSVPISPTQGHGPSVVEFTVPPAPPPPTPPPEPAEPEPDEPDAVEPAAPPPEPPPPSVEPDPPAETEEAASDQPVALTGLTLTNDGPGTGWSSAVGNGSSMRGPIRRPRPAKPQARKRDAAVRVASVRRTVHATTPEVVPVADLSRRPAPPPLNGKLVENYPRDARRRGEDGMAVVSARVDPDGRIRVASVASESASGFGEACRQTVLGSVWSPPLDAAGRAVATQIRYTCQFRVER